MKYKIVTTTTAGAAMTTTQFGTQVKIVFWPSHDGLLTLAPTLTLPPNVAACAAVCAGGGNGVANAAACGCELLPASKLFTAPAAPETIGMFSFETSPVATDATPFTTFPTPFTSFEKKDIA